jgi:hypothetical protein
VLVHGVIDELKSIDSKRWISPATWCQLPG